MSTSAPTTTTLNSLIKGKVIQGTTIVALITAMVAGLNAVSPLYAGAALPSLTAVVYVFITAFVTSAVHIAFDYYHGLPSNIVEGSIIYEPPLRSPIVVHNYPTPVTPNITVHNHPIVPTTDTQRTNYEVLNEKTATEEKTTLTTNPQLWDQTSFAPQIKTKGEEDTLKMAFPRSVTTQELQKEKESIPKE